MKTAMTCARVYAGHKILNVVLLSLSMVFCMVNQMLDAESDPEAES